MKAIIVFSGFRENEHDRSGTEDLYWDVIRKFASEPITTYHPRSWTADVHALVGQLNRRGVRHVCLVSYSHGQAAATAFARAAYAQNIDIDLWLACDPVYRPTWLPRWNSLQPLAFKAMLINGKIPVPKGIRRVVYVRQEIDRPRGHRLVATSANTYVQQPLVLPYSHTVIDEAHEWHDLVRSELQRWIQPPKPEPT